MSFHLSRSANAPRWPSADRPRTNGASTFPRASCESTRPPPERPGVARSPAATTRCRASSSGVRRARRAIDPTDRRARPGWPAWSGQQSRDTRPQDQPKGKCPLARQGLMICKRVLACQPFSSPSSRFQQRPHEQVGDGQQVGAAPQVLLVQSAVLHGHDPADGIRMRAPHPGIQLACWRRLMCSRAAIARNPERVVPASLAASSMRSSVRRAIEMFSRTVSRRACSSARSTLTAPII